ncbi:uncharacterized protein LOC144650460 isoform X2 [Oculina patagonica]
MLQKRIIALFLFAICIQAIPSKGREFLGTVGAMAADAKAATPSEVFNGADNGVKKRETAVEEEASPKSRHPWLQRPKTSPKHLKTIERILQGAKPNSGSKSIGW